MADEAGIDFMLPIGRWKGYGGDTDFHGTTLETMTWACGLLAATKRITVFGTIHAPLFNPIIAAKEFVTADHIGEGRFGLNIVAGWNEGEFEMFGVEQRDHETRYEYAEEWIEAVKRAWTEPGTFDFEGRFLKLKGVRAFPKPYGETRPLIMNAGSSGTGQAFALRNCDAFFTATSDIRASLEAAAKKVAGGEGAGRARSAARSRSTRSARWSAARRRRRPRSSTTTPTSSTPTGRRWSACWSCATSRGRTSRRRNTRRSASSSPPIRSAASLMSARRTRWPRSLPPSARPGCAASRISFVNYLDDLPFFRDEVLPRLQRMGLRANT